MPAAGRRATLSSKRAALSSKLQAKTKAGSFSEPAFLRAESYELGAVLPDVFVPTFQVLLHLCHELIGDGAIDDAMVVAERDVQDGADGDVVGALGIGEHHRLFGDAAHAEDGDVRLVDDRQSEHRAELAGVGDGERRSL